MTAAGEGPVNLSDAQRRPEFPRRGERGRVRFSGTGGAAGGTAPTEGSGADPAR